MWDVNRLTRIAATAAVLAVGALAYSTYLEPPEPPPPPGSFVVKQALDPADPAQLIVREGDLVEASGSVEDGRLCAPAPIGGISCPHGIRVTGVRPSGGTTLRGRWHPGALTDVAELPYAPTTAGEFGPGPYLPDTPPCPERPGGWSQSQDWNDEPVRAYLRANADRFAEPFATHSGNARILVVEVVTGDVDEARATLTALYSENLCVVAAPGKRTIADDTDLQATVGNAVGTLMDDPASGIYLAGPVDGRMRVNLVQLTQPLYDRFAAIGLDRLDLDPWIRPAGA